MVVLFEDCVRKVELHMKYIRLQQILEQKAREYQEVCAREKSLVSSNVLSLIPILLLIHLFIPRNTILLTKIPGLGYEIVVGLYNVMIAINRNMLFEIQ